MNFYNVYNFFCIFKYNFKAFQMGYEALVVLIFIACLFGGVYWYAGYSTKTGSAVDENQNYIPDSWEKNFGWFFSGKGIIMLIVGIGIGYALANVIG